MLAVVGPVSGAEIGGSLGARPATVGPVSGAEIGVSLGARPATVDARLPALGVPSSDPLRLGAPPGVLCSAVGSREPAGRAWCSRGRRAPRPARFPPGRWGSPAPSAALSDEAPSLARRAWRERV